MTGYIIATHASHATHSHGENLVRRAARTLLVWQERVRSRRTMAYMDDHTLTDIGMTRADIDAEVAKHFWKA